MCRFGISCSSLRDWITANSACHPLLNLGAGKSKALRRLARQGRSKTPPGMPLVLPMPPAGPASRKPARKASSAAACPAGVDLVDVAGTARKPPARKTPARKTSARKPHEEEVAERKSPPEVALAVAAVHQDPPEVEIGLVMPPTSDEGKPPSYDSCFRCSECSDATSSSTGRKTQLHSATSPSNAVAYVLSTNDVGPLAQDIQAASTQGFNMEQAIKSVALSMEGALQFSSSGRASLNTQSFAFNLSKALVQHAIKDFGMNPGAVFGLVSGYKSLNGNRKFLENGDGLKALFKNEFTHQAIHLAGFSPSKSPSKNPSKNPSKKRASSRRAGEASSGGLVRDVASG